jgi:hypothetical protein
MFEKTESQISVIIDPENALSNGNALSKNFPNEKVKKTRRRRKKEKCHSLKRCFGFCDFLSTSWKLFKEFSADTSIHGK